MKIFLDANICLDLLDTTRPTAKESIKWYMLNKDDKSKEFYFSGDFITTFYYILTQKRKLSPIDVINAIDALCSEIEPIYLNHSDFITAKNSFTQAIFDDFEDLIVLQSCIRNACEQFITNDKKLLELSVFGNTDICKP
ncbi:type II toxin-antitoxin system VapC family toxin [Arcobacter sp. FWKO B]|uniref:type II toxin-antitoxin system VapC family toxin n=1 Tax=Arcobacter sp. FWKO B TaxID=2593672 RepID=UPI0018A523F2|nr:type II toxin-antitoxin system VapC family toxin [Arcobacter sp. FWKO B]QOG12597.1 type II toxin-antitoxin system VapC family toxin [Arcobacter sp. FWKO B]